MACAGIVEQLLELSGRGILDHACHQRVSVIAERPLTMVTAPTGEYLRTIVENYQEDYPITM